MPQISSGSVLREARERKGYDLTTVARRLRIRPDILRAIEASDFSSMPPRGYTRNMVNAYARFLGLNPTEIVKMYLDEAYAHQVEKARGAAPGSGFVMDGGSYQRRPRLGLRQGRDGSGGQDRVASGCESDVGGFDDYASRSRTLSRQLYDDRTQYSHDGYGVQRGSVARSGRSDRDFLSHHSGYSEREPEQNSGSGRRLPGRSRSRERSIHVGQTPMQYSAPRFPQIFRSRAVVIAAIALVLLAIIAVVFFVTSNNAPAQQDDVSQLPVSGITDTTGTNEEEQAEEAQVEIAPTSARVAYSVKSGDECYVEIYTDDKLTTAELLSGPAQESVEVTGTWTITTWSVDTISVAVNGEPVELKPSEEYGGMYAYTVDFAVVLEEWNKTHGSKTSQRAAAVASASNAAQKASEAEAAEAEEEAKKEAEAAAKEQSSSSSSSGD